MARLAIFCSGGGSNAAKIMAYFEGYAEILVVLVIVNKPNLGAQAHATSFGIPSYLVNIEAYLNTTLLLDELKSSAVTHIILAGWLWLIPPYLLRAYPDRVVNIHPALLPSFGGKGMYGHHVHAAVKAEGAAITGPTIHVANAEFDKGEILFQAQTTIDQDDTPAIIAAKVLSLEHRYYALVIEAWILGKAMPTAD